MLLCKILFGVLKVVLSMHKLRIYLKSYSESEFSMQEKRIKVFAFKALMACNRMN